MSDQTRLPTPGPHGVPHFIEIRTVMLGFLGCRWDGIGHWVSTARDVPVLCFAPGELREWRDTRDDTRDARDARAEVQGDLFRSGIIEDPDVDGGLLG